MNNRQTYIEQVITKGLEAADDPRIAEIPPEVVSSIARTVFDALDSKYLLAGKTVPDADFEEKSIGEPPYGPQLKEASRYLPVYWALVKALGEEYSETETNIRQLAEEHFTSFGTMRRVINDAGVVRSRGGQADVQQSEHIASVPEEQPHVSDQPATATYNNAIAYMHDLRAAILENDIIPMTRPDYREQLDPLLAEGEIEIERTVHLFQARIAAYQSSKSGVSGVIGPPISAERLVHVADLYTKQMGKLLGQLGAAAIVLRNKYNTPSFMQLFEDDQLRKKVIRYMDRNHRQLIWNLADRKLEGVVPTDIGSSFSLYHPAANSIKLRKEFAALGSHFVDRTIVNSPRRAQDILATAHRNYRKLKKIKRFKVLGDGIIKELILSKPKDPKLALEEALRLFDSVRTDPGYSMFTEGDIRNLMGKSSVTVLKRLDKARQVVAELTASGKYKALDPQFIARQVLKRPKTIRTYLDEVVTQLDMLASEPRFSRFDINDILFLIESSPAKAHAIMTHAVDAMERIEADPECVAFGVSYASVQLLKDEDPYNKFKEMVARYKKRRANRRYATLNDHELKTRSYS